MTQEECEAPTPFRGEKISKCLTMERWDEVIISSSIYLTKFAGDASPARPGVFFQNSPLPPRLPKILDFANASGTKLVFGLSFFTNDDKSWNMTNAAALLRYTADAGKPVCVLPPRKSPTCSPGSQHVALTYPPSSFSSTPSSSGRR